MGTENTKVVQFSSQRVTGARPPAGGQDRPVLAQGPQP